MLDAKLDLLMSEQFAKNAYDPSEALSTEDRLVLNKYEKSIINIGNWHQIGLPFKEKGVKLQNNYTNALSRLVKQEQGLKEIKI